MNALLKHCTMCLFLIAYGHCEIVQYVKWDNVKLWLLWSYCKKKNRSFIVIERYSQYWCRRPFLNDHINKEIMFFYFVLIAIVLLYYYLTWHFDYWRDRNVLGPIPWPFVGTFRKSAIYLQNFIYDQDEIYRWVS